MKRTSKHIKETAKPVQQPAHKTPAGKKRLTEIEKQKIGEHLASTGLFNPLSIALATGDLRPVPPLGRPRKHAARDAAIVRARDVEGMTFGEVAHRMKIGREVAMSAYYRMKRNTPTR